MKSLQIQDVSLSFGEREILKDISFNMNEKTRAALAGANGSGKSTLLKAISGRLQADSIKISLTKDARISYLEQSDVTLSDKTVYETAEQGYRRFDEINDEIKRLEDKTQLSGEIALKAAKRLSELHEVLIDSGYYNRKSRIEKILQGLGFKASDFSRSVYEFSGGYQMRIALARILVENPDFMFLDEPTNYLDIEALTWLKEYLKAFSSGLMIVSHDQDFLDEITTEVYELFKGKLTRYSGNYSKYLITREAELSSLEKEYKRQQDEIKKTEDFIEKFRYKATKAKQVQSRIKALDKIDVIEIPDHLKKLSFTFPPSPHSGNDVIKVDKLTKKYSDNIIYNDFSFIVRKKEYLAITGKNGAGKSTLLRILAGVDRDYTGTVTDGAEIVKGYFAQDTENTLNDENSVLEELETVASISDEPRLRNMLGAFLFSDDDVFKKVKVLSGGEKSRLALLKILLHPSNLLLLDEPTNHLDINAKEMLTKAIKSYEGTVIFVSHDKHFIRSLATRILYISEYGPEFFDGDYSYFEYKLEENEAKWKIEKESKVTLPDEEEKRADDYHSLKEKRNQIKSLEREIEKISNELDVLNSELKKLDEDISKSENYSDPVKITALIKKQNEIKERIEKEETLWLEKTDALEEMNGKNN